MNVGKWTNIWSSNRAERWVGFKSFTCRWHARC